MSGFVLLMVTVNQVFSILWVIVILKYSVLFMGTVTTKCSVLVKVIITLERSAPLMITINLKISVLLMVTNFEGFSAPYGHFHPALFSAPYSHCHSALYRYSPVLMNVPVPRTTSLQKHAAASHSCHFNTVMYLRSYSEC